MGLLTEENLLGMPSMREEKVMMFPTELDFQSWFRANSILYGYTHVLEEHRSMYKLPYPDYWCVTPDMRVRRVEIELTAITFLTHEHDPKGADEVICAENNLRYYGVTLPIPVVSLPITGATSRATSSANPRCLQQVWEAAHNPKLLPRLLTWGHQKGNLRCYYCGKEVPGKHNDCLKGLEIWVQKELYDHPELSSQFAG